MRTYTRKSLEERFWPKVSIGAPDECWDWIGATVHGYGYLGLVPASSLGPRIPIIHATHASWKIHYGEFPAPGMCVCHTCDRPPCVNPAHLFLGTQADNNRDRSRKGRDGVKFLANQRPGHPGVSMRGRTNPNSKLSPEQVQEIRDRYAAGSVSQDALAAQYDITQAHVSRLVRGASYVDLT